MKTNQLLTNNGKKNESIKFSSLSLIILLCCMAFGFTAKSAPDITVPTTFKSLDASDGLQDGVYNAAGNLTIKSGGSIIMDLPFDTAISIVVAGKFTMEDASEINSDGDLLGYDTRITAGGDITLIGTAYIHANNLHQTNSTRAGDITIISNNGNFSMATLSIIETIGNEGGDILIQTKNPGSSAYIDGTIQSIGHVSGTGTPGGGWIQIITGCKLIEDDNAIIQSIGGDPGADLIHLEACVVNVYGLVKSYGPGHVTPINHLDGTFRPDKPAHSTVGIEIWASDSVNINNTGSHNGELQADLCCSGGTSGEAWIDILASGAISILGRSTGHFAVHAIGSGGNTDNGGTVTIKSIAGKVFASGRAVMTDGTAFGGKITVEAKSDVDLSGGILESTGGTFNVFNTGGIIKIRSFGTAAPNTGSILSNASTLINAIGGQAPYNGIVELRECGTTAFLGTILGDPSPLFVTGLCDGTSPALPCSQNPDPTCNCLCNGGVTYVVLPASCGGTCTTCNIAGCLRVSKFAAVSLSVCPPGSSHAPLPAKWNFTVSGPTPKAFSLPAVANVLRDTLVCGLANGSYTVTETPVAGWETAVNGAPGTTATFTVAGCDTAKVPYINANTGCIPDTGCCWCNKAAVQSQVVQNMITCCIKPDYLVDLRQGHALYDPAKKFSNLPAFGSLQDAIDYVNTHPADADPNNDGQIFIAVTVSDCDTTNMCTATDSRPPGGDTPFGTENVIVTNNYTKRLNIFGCSVTIKAADPTKPVITINNAAGKGKITVLDIHVKGSTATAGYCINNKGDLVIVKNGRAIGNDIGIKVASTSTGKIEITGSPEISGNRIGISLEGSNTLLRDNNHIDNNTQYGVVISGTTGNATSGNGIHKNGTGGMLISGSSNDMNPGGDEVSENTGVGITVTGNSNKLYDEDVISNTSHGIVITGNSNSLEKSKHIEKNGGHGIYVYHASPTYATGNKLTENVATSNGKDGINANVGNFASTTNLVKNQGNKNVGYGIRPCGQTNGGNNTASGNGNNTITFVGCSTRMAGEEDDIDMTSVNLNTITGIYPNPTLGNVTISFNSIATAKFTLKVVDMIGQVVINEALEAKEGQNIHELDLSAVAKGVYTVVLEKDGFKDHKTIVVK